MQTKRNQEQMIRKDVVGWFEFKGNFNII